MSPPSRVRTMNQSRSIQPGAYVRLLDDLGQAARVELRAAAGGRLRGRTPKAAGDPRGAALRLPGRERPAPSVRPRRHGGQPARTRREGARSTIPTSSPRAATDASCSPRSSSDACVVVTDWYPAFFLPQDGRGGGQRGSGPARGRRLATESIPLAEHGKAFTAARFYRAFVQRVLRDHVTQVPDEAPLAAFAEGHLQLSRCRGASTRRWPRGEIHACRRGVKALAALPIDHSIRTSVHARRQTRHAAQLAALRHRRSSPPMTTAATIPTTRGRAGCRPICISVICRLMRSSRPS